MKAALSTYKARPLDTLEKLNREFMMKRKPEVKLLIKILAIFGFVIILLLIAGYIYIRINTPELLKFSKGIDEYQLSISLDSIPEARFITGMNGCENLVLATDSKDFFVSCLDGYIHRLSPDSTGAIEIISSYKAGNAAMGLAIDKDGSLIAAISENPIEDWSSKGGAIYEISSDFSSKQKISDDFPALNGICLDGAGNLYFASSNFDFINPIGLIYRMILGDNEEFTQPKPAIHNAGLANGLYYDPLLDMIIFSNTTGGVYEFVPGDSVLQEVYLKLRFMEACDDMCTDIGGNIWMTDPGYSTVKMYNPGTGRLVRFNIKGIGQTSSCRIRWENNDEILYITELKMKQKPVSDKFDGRGVLVVPVRSLLTHLEPLLIQ